LALDGNRAMPRFYCPTPLRTGELLELPGSAARHVQVLRLQPGDVITLFNTERSIMNNLVVIRI